MSFDTEHCRYDLKRRLNQLRLFVIGLPALLVFLTGVVILAAPLSGANPISLGNAGAAEDSAQDVITVYCAAAVKKPVTALAEQYQAETGTRVELIYGNSGELLSQMKSRQGKSVYIPTDPTFLQQLEGHDFNIFETSTLAYNYPVIVTPNAIEKDLSDWQDIKETEPEFLLVKPQLSALGRSTEQLLQDTGLKPIAEANLRGRVTTANQVPLYLSMGIAEVGITWFSEYLEFEEQLSLIDYPQAFFENVPVKGAAVTNQIIPSEKRKKEHTGRKVGESNNGPPLLGVSQDKVPEVDFLNFLSSDKGTQVFQDYGYSQ